MDKREEAARAVQAKAPWSEGLDDEKALEYVDAVIACIREPDEKMMRAGKYGEGDLAKMVQIQMWQGMIDAIGD